MGDVLSAGPVWSRPVRLGGFEITKDFSQRPDLVTSPMPAFRGTAAVPSSVDVFINNVKAYSQDTAAGPFTISNLPTVNGAGTATIVVRDAAGHETRQQTSFFAAPSLLRSGLFEYSIDGGFARKGFGVTSFDYDDRPLTVMNLKYGLHDNLTVEAHAEAARELALLGTSATFTLFDSALISLAASASQSNGGPRSGAGAQLYGMLRTQFGPLSLSLSTQRTLGTYRDLAALIGSNTQSGFVATSVLSLDPPRRLDVASLTLPLENIGGSISLNLIDREGDRDSARIITGSYSRPLIENASVTATGFYDQQSHNTGFFVGVSIPLGTAGHGQVGYNSTGSAISAGYSKPAGREPGSVGWNVSARDGQVPYHSAAVTYQGNAARAEVGLDQSGNAVRGRAVVDGAVVTTGKGVFVANRVNDGFAVIDVGAPDVDVLLDNRRIATTGQDGLAFVPDLKPWQRNKISIDPTALPVDLTMPVVEVMATPAGRTGVAVDLKAQAIGDAAVVIFTDATGAHLPAGTMGKLDGSGASFVIGYDGRAYLEHLAAQNSVTIDLVPTPCRTTFAFQPQPGRQVVINAPQCK